MSHWTPYNPNGGECRFCSNPPHPMCRNSEDVQAYLACHDARFPPLYTRLRGLLAQLERAGRS